MRTRTKPIIIATAVIATAVATLITVGAVRSGTAPEPGGRPASAGHEAGSEGLDGPDGLGDGSGVGPDGSAVAPGAGEDDQDGWGETPGGPDGSAGRSIGGSAFGDDGGTDDGEASYHPTAQPSSGGGDPDDPAAPPAPADQPGTPPAPDPGPGTPDPAPAGGGQSVARPLISRVCISTLPTGPIAPAAPRPHLVRVETGGAEQVTLESGPGAAIPLTVTDGTATTVRAWLDATSPVATVRATRGPVSDTFPIILRDGCQDHGLAIAAA